MIRLKYYYLLFIISTPLVANSQNWTSLGGGLVNAGNCLFSDSNYLYVGQGQSSPSDNALAIWDGVKWDSLGNGTGANVRSIVSFQGELFAGGGLGVYKWDGTNWVVPGGGLNGAVFQLYSVDSLLYAVGAFDTAGGMAANNIAKWDGVKWERIDTTIWGSLISCVISYRGDIYIGGNHFDLDGLVVGIARWDGAQWQPVGNAITVSSSVNCFEVFQDILYVGGIFQKNGGDPGDGIASWDGATWSDVGGGLPKWVSMVHDMEAIDSTLYVGGGFNVAGSISAQNIALWDGKSWCGLGSQFDNKIGYITTYKNEIYITGGFWNIDTSSMLRVARWTGGSYVDTCGMISFISNRRSFNTLFELVPNPSNSNVFLRGSTNKPVTVLIFDLVGREMINIAGQTNNFPIHVGNLESGLYIYYIIDDKRMVGNGKLVIP